MIAHEFAQGSEHWFKMRAGVVTASEMDNLVTPLGKLRSGQMVESYLNRKVAERWIKGPLIQATSFAPEQGTLLEKEVIPWLKLEHELKVRRVSFVTTDDCSCGCSPDGMIGDDSGIEIKCPMLPKQIEYLLAGTLPSDYVLQVQTSMFVTGFETWRFCSYSRNLPTLLITVARDEKFQLAIAEAVKAANEAIADRLNRIKELT